MASEYWIISACCEGRGFVLEAGEERYVVTAVHCRQRELAAFQRWQTAA